MRDTGGAAAEVEDQVTALQLVLGEAGDGRGVACRHHALDLDVAALEAGEQVAQGRAGNRHQVRDDLEALPGQAASVLERTPAVDRHLHRHRMQHLAVGRGGLAARAVEQELQAGLGDAAAVQRESTRTELDCTRPPLTAR